MTNAVSPSTTISSASRVSSHVAMVRPVAASRTLTGARMPSVTKTRSPTATSRRVRLAGPALKPNCAGHHSGIARSHSKTPLNASRAVSFQSGWKDIDAGD